MADPVAGGVGKWEGLEMDGHIGQQGEMISK